MALHYNLPSIPQVSRYIFKNYEKYVFMLPPNLVVSGNPTRQLFIQKYRMQFMRKGVQFSYNFAMGSRCYVSTAAATVPVE